MRERESEKKREEKGIISTKCNCKKANHIERIRDNGGAIWVAPFTSGFCNRYKTVPIVITIKHDALWLQGDSRRVDDTWKETCVDKERTVKKRADLLEIQDMVADADANVLLLQQGQHRSHEP